MEILTTTYTAKGITRLRDNSKAQTQLQHFITVISISYCIKDPLVGTLQLQVCVRGGTPQGIELSEQKDQECVPGTAVQTAFWIEWYL